MVHCALADPVRVSSVSSVAITRPLRAHVVRSRVPGLLLRSLPNFLDKYLHSSEESYSYLNSLLFRNNSSHDTFFLFACLTCYIYIHTQLVLCRNDLHSKMAGKVLSFCHIKNIRKK